MKKMKNDRCMFSDCGKEKTYARSLCLSHYNLINNAVKKKGKTWEDFEKYGYCLPAKKGRTSEVSRHFCNVIEKMK